jgi:hypothetical protein
MCLNGGLRLRRAALAGVISVGLAGCGSATEAAGRVVDPVGRPVAGALVLLRRAGQTPRDAEFAERADSNGGFHAILYGGYLPPDAVLSVCAPGFAPAEQRVVGGKLAAGLAVELRPGRGEGPLCEVPPGLAVVERGGAAAESPPPAR